MSRNVSLVQEFLGRTILVENPSAYLRFSTSRIPEPEFLAALARRTGCGLLCDVNNIFVSAVNFGLDAAAYLERIPPDAVGEIHLAGHFRSERRGRQLLIDDHGSTVCDEVWALYGRAIDRFAMVPSLVEWDKNLPALAELLAEARKAEAVAASALVADVNPEDASPTPTQDTPKKSAPKKIAPKSRDRSGGFDLTAELSDLFRDEAVVGFSLASP